jgi:hypothetical protein
MSLVIPPQFQPAIHRVTVAVKDAYVLHRKLRGSDVPVKDTSYVPRDVPRSPHAPRSPHGPLDAVVELEARLGTLRDMGDGVPPRFDAHVTHNHFQAVLARLSRFDKWVYASPDWERVTDSMFSVDSGGSSGACKVRTRVRMSSDAPPMRESISKDRVCNVDVRTHMECAGTGRPGGVDVRCSVSMETPRAAKAAKGTKRKRGAKRDAKSTAYLPTSTTPSWVRIKQQRRFRLPFWEFVVAKVWGGASRSVVAAAMSRGDSPVYEIELECTDLDAALAHARGTLEYVSLTMLMKLSDFFPTPGAAASESGADPRDRQRARSARREAFVMTPV